MKSVENIMFIGKLFELDRLITNMTKEMDEVCKQY
jgi:hypothetical protein